MPALAAQSRKTKFIQGLSLEAFRESMPEYRKEERYWFGRFNYDVVKGYWLALGRELVHLDSSLVADWAKSLSLDHPLADPGTPDRVSLFVHVSDSTLRERWDEIDLDRPLLFGTVRIQPDPKGLKREVARLLDGHHRLRKAFLENIPLKAFLLDIRETNSLLDR